MYVTRDKLFVYAAKTLQESTYFLDVSDIRALYRFTIGISKNGMWETKTVPIPDTMDLSNSLASEEPNWILTNDNVSFFCSDGLYRYNISTNAFSRKDIVVKSNITVVKIIQTENFYAFEYISSGLRFVTKFESKSSVTDDEAIVIARHDYSFSGSMDTSAVEGGDTLYRQQALYRVSARGYSKIFEMQEKPLYYKNYDNNIFVLFQAVQQNFLKTPWSRLIGQIPYTGMTTTEDTVFAFGPKSISIQTREGVKSLAIASANGIFCDSKYLYVTYDCASGQGILILEIGRFAEYELIDANNDPIAEYFFPYLQQPNYIFVNSPQAPRGTSQKSIFDLDVLYPPRIVGPRDLLVLINSKLMTGHITAKGVALISCNHVESIMYEILRTYMQEGRYESFIIFDLETFLFL
jgi:hypothetical protein